MKYIIFIKFGIGIYICKLNLKKRKKKGYAILHLIKIMEYLIKIYIISLKLSKKIFNKKGFFNNVWIFSISIFYIGKIMKISKSN